jgi:hypothetical protein
MYKIKLAFQIWSEGFPWSCEPALHLFFVRYLSHNKYPVDSHFKQDSFYVFPEIKLRGLVPNFHPQQNRWIDRENI